MIPYADFLYFGIVAIYIALPTLLVRLVRGFSKTWVLLATLLMLIVQYGGILDTGPAPFAPGGTGGNTAPLAPGGRGVGGEGSLAAGAFESLKPLAAYALFQWVIARGFLLVRSRGASRSAYYLALTGALLPLALAKFLPLVFPDALLGFVGISYVTFRSLDVIFSIQDRVIVSLPPGQYLAFLFFFPTISSGPIDRYRRFAEDWNRSRSRAELLVDLDGAVHRIFNGFLLKFILAALVERYWMERVDPKYFGLGWLNTLSFMYAYSFYLFFDFAGYSCFAIGVSYLLGIHSPENFNRPYLARNIRDFWNRWHMTLTAWLRDHIYMRFVLAATKGKWFKNRQTANYLGISLAFGLMGLWHGTQPFYLLYGLYHAGLMAGYEWFSRWNREHKWWGEGWPWRLAAIVLTFHIVCLGFLLFSGRLGPYWIGAEWRPY